MITVDNYFSSSNRIQMNLTLSELMNSGSQLYKFLKPFFHRKFKNEKIYGVPLKKTRDDFLVEVPMTLRLKV